MKFESKFSIKYGRKEEEKECNKVYSTETQLNKRSSGFTWL